ncbi:MAG: DUF853 family protein [Planctomycetes bacterium]|nr:DUF853 family protein [Planctomycetota bacterium]
MTSESHADPRLAAVLRADAAAVFHPIQHRGDVFRPDPLDVGRIHAEAREVFDALVARACDAQPNDSGRMLLVLGESGAGKTHLMRAFRSRVHAERRGFVSYVQMTSSASNYLRYVLRNVIESLGVAYDPEHGEATGLDALSNALCALPDACSDAELDLLRTTDDTGTLRRTAWRVGNRIVNRMLPHAAQDVDADVVFQLLFLQRGLPTVHRAVTRFLSCEELGARERELLGGVASRTRDEDPFVVLRSLARLVSVLDGGAFVICVDQLEDAYRPDADAEQPFRRVMLGLRELTDAVPNAVAVLACLGDYFEQVRHSVSQSVLDRITLDPQPIQLRATLDEDEAAALIGARLAFVLERHGVRPDPADPLAPFHREQLARLGALRIRDVLEACRRALELARARGTVPDLASLAIGDPQIPPTAPAAPAEDWQRTWDDFRTDLDRAPPDDEQELAQLIADTLAGSSVELPDGVRLDVSRDANRIRVSGAGRELLIGVCERAARGGGLQRQLVQLQNKAAGRIAAIVRSSSFPDNPRTIIARMLGEFVAEGNRRAVCSGTQWKAMLAMSEFARRHSNAAGFDAWRRRERPMLSLPVIRDVLRLDGVPGGVPGTPTESPAPVATPTPPGAADIRLGTTTGLRAAPLEIPLASLTRHAAFLGGTGSGKTTLALAIVEQALLAGVPVLCVDRKGDLAAYADPTRFASSHDPERARALRDAIDVRLWTPGDPAGRDLAVPILPAADAGLSAHEREVAVQHYAGALAAMLDPGRGRGASRQRTLAILQTGLGVLDACRGDATLGLRELCDAFAGPDPAITAALGQIDPKHLQKVAEQLECLRINERALLDNAAGERLDVAELLGLGLARGAATRLAIVSTGALGQQERILFLVTHLLVALGRYAERHPSGRLQALVLLDEADLYLPAGASPPTKAPLEHGLRRFRSAGIGLLLATQSPGDLDYRCRENVQSWFVGKVTQQTALKKLETLFGADRAAAQRVPGQSIGEFHLLQDGRCTPFRANRNLLETRQLAPAGIAALARGSSPRA